MVAHCDIQSPRPPNGSQPWAWYLVWPKLSISHDLLVETQLFLHHGFMTMTAVCLFCLYFSPSSHGLQAILLCSSLIICHWLRQPDCQSHSRGQPTCLFPFTEKPLFCLLLHGFMFKTTLFLLLPANRQSLSICYTAVRYYLLTLKR